MGAKKSHLEEVFEYCNDVVNGKILANRWVKLACKRTLNDFKNSSKKDFPFYFDEKEANKVIDFAQATKQYEGQWKGKCLKLMPWQKHILMNIYGWKNKKDNYRRYRKAFIQVGRKSGKSTMISAVLLYDLLMTAGAQVYAACTKRETAKIIYNHCKETIRQNTALSNRLKVYASTSRIVNERNAGFLEALPYDPDRMDGLNPSVCCIDEVASMDDHSIIQRLQSGMGARPEGLIFEISSASDNVNSVGAEEFKQAKDILEGVIHTDESESFFCIMYCLDDGDDWTDESKYIKANPSLGHTVSADFLHKQRLEAERNPFLQGEFKTRNLGLYVAPMKAWIQPKIWNGTVENANKYKVDFSKPYYAVGAVDLSKRSDLTAFTVCVYQQEKYFLFHKAYFPIQMMEEKLKKDSAMWRKWTEDGILTATEGSVVDYRQLFADIMEAYEKYKLDCVLFDPYNSNSLITELQENIDLVEVPQNIKNLSPFTKRFEEEIYRGNIVDNNPLMRWQMSHAEVYRDANENMKIVKPDSKSSGKRIDNVITSLMCVGRIGSLLDEGDIDLRSNEEVEMQTASFLKGLNIYG